MAVLGGGEQLVKGAVKIFSMEPEGLDLRGVAGVSARPRQVLRRRFLELRVALRAGAIQALGREP